ncbi:hypothetical protein K440DRAFT_638120 [Wilcoxina mikolae CBS 423.85]|nr:hypothetical protein K440DRAFT_638120 [Wilcoxina mikolae CBS 423.85]
MHLLNLVLVLTAFRSRSRLPPYLLHISPWLIQNNLRRHETPIKKTGDWLPRALSAERLMVLAIDEMRGGQFRCVAGRDDGSSRGRSRGKTVYRTGTGTRGPKVQSSSRMPIGSYASRSERRLSTPPDLPHTAAAIAQTVYRPSLTFSLLPIQAPMIFNCGTQISPDGFCKCLNSSSSFSQVVSSFLAIEEQFALKVSEAVVELQASGVRQDSVQDMWSGTKMWCYTIGGVKEEGSAGAAVDVGGDSINTEGDTCQGYLLSVPPDQIDLNALKTSIGQEGNGARGVATEHAPNPQCGTIACTTFSFPEDMLCIPKLHHRLTSSRPSPLPPKSEL